MIQFIVTYLFVTFSVVISRSHVSIITPQLENTFRENDKANIFVTLKADTSSVLDTIANSPFQTREEKLYSLHALLQGHAQETQQPILNFLSSRIETEDLSIHVNSFWITNQIYIQNADKPLVFDLAATFGHLVSSIDKEFFAKIIEPVSIETNISWKFTENDDVAWGVDKIQAPEAWKQLGGILNAGEDVIVATIDTGVRGTHDALKDNFVGEYGWYDPASRTSRPTDYQGHGTHTMGTIAGGKGIGVAPTAKWASCRGCANVFCAQSHLLACGEFFTCPTLANGSIPDCSRAPHLVSNSWGGGRGNTWYNSVIDAWHTAGIIPLFSIGNSGPICNTADSPGDQNVIGVGSTTASDAISLFSSVGPTIDGRMKPEITAPGSNVISAYHNADDDYVSLSGTSMACPHAAGTVALLLTRNKELTYQQAKELLFAGADQNLQFSRRLCGGIRDDVFPNYAFGHGRINALKSVQTQTRFLLQSET